MDNREEPIQVKQDQLRHYTGSFWSNLRFDRRLWDNQEFDLNNTPNVTIDPKLNELKVSLENKWQSLQESLKTIWNRSEKTNESLVHKNSQQIINESNNNQTLDQIKSSVIDTSMNVMSTSTKLSLRS